MKKVHIKNLDLGHGVKIVDDQIITSVQESESEKDALGLDETFAELEQMAQKVDEYYEKNGI